MYDANIWNYDSEHVGDVNDMASETKHVSNPQGVIISRIRNFWHCVSLISHLLLLLLKQGFMSNWKFAIRFV